MGRGGYDVTDAREGKSMAEYVLGWEDNNRKKREDIAAKAAVIEAEEKLIRSKKSRGIMAARKIEKEAVLKSEPIGDRLGGT